MTPLRVAQPPPKPLLVFDGDCAFCRRWIARWRQMTGDQVEYTPLQSDLVAGQFPELPRDQLATAVHLIQPDGTVTRAAEAVFRSLSVVRPAPWWCYRNVPGFAPVAELAYRIVARNRTLFSFVTRILWGTSVELPTYFFVRRLFLGLLGVTYFVAFLSWERQWPGLIGSNGIAPAQQTMEAVRANTTDLGLDRYRVFPSLCWYRVDDAFLRQLCRTGLVLSGLVILNFAPAPSLFLLWLIYLSLCQVGDVFLGYQWDNLLLEAGFLAIFFAPLRLWPRPTRDRLPSGLVLWLLRWLLFRLMFASGAIKLLSGDATWHDLTALTVHYETQPLPTPLAWYAHHLPGWLHRMSCGAMFVIELALPFLIFLPRRPRLLAFGGFTLLMFLIALTGNYTFFNLLAFALAVLLLDDRALERWAPRWWAHRIADGVRPTWSRPRPVWLRWSGRAFAVLLAALILGVSSVQLVGMAGGRWSGEHPLIRLARWASPFRSINGYGLFAVMTTERPEIIIEGSNDRRTWLAYEFPHKPGDLQRPPTFVAPHQPRLDWQMWFAALGGDVRRNPWFISFCLRLLQGKREVLVLLEKNPFPDRPPRYIRALLYQYHFTSPAEREKSGAWWRRELKGEYCRPISAREAAAAVGSPTGFNLDPDP